MPHKWKEHKIRNRDGKNPDLPYLCEICEKCGWAKCDSLWQGRFYLAPKEAIRYVTTGILTHSEKELPTCKELSNG